MGQEKPRWQRPIRRRTLPSDQDSLVSVVRVAHQDLQRVAEHLKGNSHDLQTRRAFQELYKERSAAWFKLFELDSKAALRLSQEVGLHPPIGVLELTLPQQQVAQNLTEEGGK